MAPVFYCACDYCNCTATVLFIQKVQGENTNDVDGQDISHTQIEEQKELHINIDYKAATELVIIIIYGIFMTIGK